MKYTKERLPEYWVIRQDKNHKNFFEALKIINRLFGANCSGNGEYKVAYYGNTREGRIRYSTTYPNSEVTKLLSIDEFIELTTVEEFILPKEWYARVTEENLKILAKWKELPEVILRPGYIVGMYKYNNKPFPVKSWNIEINGNWKNEITFEQFKKYVLKENMEKINQQHLNKGQLTDLYNQFSCDKWKAAIKPYLINNFEYKDSHEIVLDQKDLELLLKEGSALQKDAVTKLGIVLEKDNNAFIKDFSNDEDVINRLGEISERLFGENDIMLLRKLEYENIKGRAFYFNPDKVELSIVNDSNGKPCILKVTKK